MYFSETFLSIMIIVALTGISIAAVVLVLLLIRDIKSKKLW